MDGAHWELLLHQDMVGHQVAQQQAVVVHHVLVVVHQVVVVVVVFLLRLADRNRIDKVVEVGQQQEEEEVVEQQQHQQRHLYTGVVLIHLSTPPSLLRLAVGLATFIWTERAWTERSTRRPQLLVKHSLRAQRVC